MKIYASERSLLMVSLNNTLGSTPKNREKALEGKPVSQERLLGNYSRGEDGPVLVITADIFDGQTSAVTAFHKVLRTISLVEIPFKGELRGLAGNIKTKKKGILTQLKQSLSIKDGFLTPHTETSGYNEAAEFVDLIEEYEKASNSTATGVYYLDLKTSANIRKPYLCSSKNPNSMDFAPQFPLPHIRGMEEYVTDHMGFYLNAKCYVGCTLFVGSNALYDAAEMHEAAIWLALVNSGCVNKSDVPDLHHFQRLLEGSWSKNEGHSFEVIYKYCIQEDEFFRMLPGFENFQKIKKGQVLATSDGGSVISQWDGSIFMPLYHTQCQDGFFVLKDIT